MKPNAKFITPRGFDTVKRSTVEGQLLAYRKVIPESARDMIKRVLAGERRVLAKSWNIDNYVTILNVCGIKCRVVDLRHGRCIRISSAIID